MIELESVIAHWKALAESVALDRHPSLWVGHYTDVLQGDCFSTNPANEVMMTMLLASPFATCADIAETYIIRDRPGVLLVTRLEQGITHWQIRYARGDGFQLSFAVAEPAHSDIDGVAKALLAHRGNGRSYDFEEAFWYAVRRGHEWER